MTRRADLNRLYSLLEQLKNRVDGMELLENCTGRMDWPDRGLYFFFTPDETRSSTDQLRLTRVGTHAVSEGSGTTLWNRLITHRGTLSGKYEDGGNHRGSVFRLRVGEALIERHGLRDEFPRWGEGSSAGSEIRERELPLERQVSEYIRSLPFLWVEVDDEPGPESRRAYIERNAIALVSNFDKDSIDPRDPTWLGKHSTSESIRASGLWNVNHVNDTYDPEFLDTLQSHIIRTTPA